jgi:hypothetical protein
MKKLFEEYMESVLNENDKGRNKKGVNILGIETSAKDIAHGVVGAVDAVKRTKEKEFPKGGQKTNLKGAPKKVLSTMKTFGKNIKDELVDRPAKEERVAKRAEKIEKIHSVAEKRSSDAKRDKNNAETNRRKSEDAYLKVKNNSKVPDHEKQRLEDRLTTDTDEKNQAEKIHARSERQAKSAEEIKRKNDAKRKEIEKREERVNKVATGIKQAAGLSAVGSAVYGYHKAREAKQPKGVAKLLKKFKKTKLAKVAKKRGKEAFKVASKQMKKAGKVVKKSLLSTKTGRKVGDYLEIRPSMAQRLKNKMTGK